MTRAPTEMELRVAKAICNVSNRAPWADENYDLFLDEARAAIRAMRELTPSMEIAAGNPSRKSLGQLPMWLLYKNAYQAMIDAASPEEK